MTPQEQFRKLCESHDLTYDYSDDGRVYSKGKDEYDTIRAFANNNLTRVEAAQIWNSVVESKLRFNREEYYWSV